MAPEVVVGSKQSFQTQTIGFGKGYISSASAYPPDFDSESCVMALTMEQAKLNCNNLKEIEKQYNIDRNLTVKLQEKDLKFVNFKIERDRLNLERNVMAVIDFDMPQTRDNECVHTISDSQDKWWITVPMRINDTKIEWIRMLADPGANIGCINTKFAIDRFPDCIVKNNNRGVLATPNGHILPKYALWLKFPAKKGFVYAARFLLLDDLPAPILADINMLRAWGYKFQDGVPPVFKHHAIGLQTQDLNTQFEEKYKINKPVVNYTELRNLDTNTKITPTIFDKYTNAKLANVSEFYNIPSITVIDSASDRFQTQIAALFDSNKFNSVYTAILEMNAFTTQNTESAADTAQAMIKSHLKLISQTQMQMDSIMHQVNLNHLTVEYALQDIDSINNNNLQSQTPTPHFSAKFQSSFEEEREPDIGDIDPWQDYELWKRRLDTVEKIGGDLDTRNHNLCMLINNQESRIIRTGNKVNNPTAISVKQKQKQKDSTKRSTANQETSENTETKQANQVGFISSPNHILATPEEIEEAKRLHKNAELKFNDLTYLLDYEREDKIKYKNLYKRTKQLILKYKYRVFALHTYDRKTMKLNRLARLGLKEEFRNVTHYLEQYPLSRDKKLAMINETIEMDKNGFWIPIESNQHNIPYTVIAKKPDKEGYIRHRAAFDARSINKYCELIKARMPTMRDFDDFYAKPGLVTLADFKNFLDCIPLDERNWQYAVVQTPLGLRMMKHCSYGWKNSAPNAQNVTNEMSAKIKGMMGYIDDIAIKHDDQAGTDELLQHLEKFFQVCEEYKVLIHPEKFFPFASEVESLGIKRTRYGSEITKKYREKVLGLKKPTNTDELRAAIGVIQYIARYIYMYALFAYWLVILLNEFEGKSQIKWTKEADAAWESIKRMVAEAPVLSHPTKDGQFCMKCDGCPYGVGAVLYQWQYDEVVQTSTWKIIDMYSKIIPQA